MKGRMQKTSPQANDCPQRDRTESEWYEGVQTYIWMTEDNVVEVPFDKEHLLDVILSPLNLNKAYKCVVDLDLERLFDTVCHSKLIEVLSRTIKDGRVISLIHRYLRSGLMVNGLFMRSEEDTLAFITNMSNGYLNREPLYAERHVQWCERSINTKVGDKHLQLMFTSYSIAQMLNLLIYNKKVTQIFGSL